MFILGLDNGFSLDSSLIDQVVCELLGGLVGVGDKFLFDSGVIPEDGGTLAENGIEGMLGGVGGLYMVHYFYSNYQL